jgi:CarD family transcriptional regulator
MDDLLELNVGDHVVYPNHGAGVIMRLSQREVMGKRQAYFEIELLKGGLQVMVPLARAQQLGLRRITAAENIPALLSAFDPPDIDLPVAWTPRHRREQNLLSEGDIFKIAQLVGTLHRRSHQRSLAVTERAIYEEAKSIIVTEMAVALTIPVSSAEAQVEDQLALCLPA